jgi:hypothetical protein
VTEDSSAGPQSSPEIDTTVSHSARVVLSGSYFAIAQPTIEITGERMAEAIRHWNEFGTPPGIHRTPQQIAALFDGLELVEPGVVSCTRWRPETTPNGVPDEMDLFVAVGRKP